MCETEKWPFCCQLFQTLWFLDSLYSDLTLYDNVTHSSIFPDIKGFYFDPIKQLIYADFILNSQTIIYQSSFLSINSLNFINSNFCTL